MYYLILYRILHFYKHIIVACKIIANIFQRVYIIIVACEIIANTFQRYSNEGRRYFPNTSARNMANLGLSECSAAGQQTTVKNECWFSWLMGRVGLKNGNHLEDNTIESMENTTRTEERIERLTGVRTEDLTDVRSEGLTEVRTEGLTEIITKGRTEEVKTFTVKANLLKITRAIETRIYTFIWF